MIKPKQEIPGEFFDLDHYIGRVKALQKTHGNHLKVAFDALLNRLEMEKKAHSPLLDIADNLMDAVGPFRKGEMEVLAVYRRLAQAIRERWDLK
jgi:hypothetical protein